MTGPPSGLSADLERRVAAWTAQDPDPATRAEVDRLLTAATGGDPAAGTAAAAELGDAFGARLAFGTAGLRGALGPGPNRMNRVVVGQAAAGLARYLLDQGPRERGRPASGPVVVGHDARDNSAVFARDTAEILAGAGLDVLLAATPLPTPVVAFGIRHLGCVAGVVVTASHNPARDNGYKVYLGDGSQIVPPADAEIAARILEVAGHDLTDVPRSPAYGTVDDELVEAYLDRLATLVPTGSPRRLPWAYTALHGVGGALAVEVADRLGFDPPAVVAEQQQPDPAFPTVAFPNPEEPGALDLLVARAAADGAELAIANDPDADRCAVALPADGGWRVLRGDELGALLADDALRRGVTGTYACSVVSSSLLSRMAAAHGQPYAATLTGFKWIGRVPGLAFGYEEAIGYCVDPQAVPDKDGISALVRVLALAADLRAGGQTLGDRLDEITRAYGLHATDQLAVRVDDPALIGEAMARLRERPPGRLLGELVEVTDLARGSADLPPTDGIRLAGGSLTVVVRPSGTEPKLKAYLEVRLGVADSQDVAAARATARQRLDRLRTELSVALGLG